MTDVPGTVEDDVPQRFLRAREAAHYLGLMPKSLATYRWMGRGPTFFKSESGSVYYSIADLDEWITSHAGHATR